MNNEKQLLLAIQKLKHYYFGHFMRGETTEIDNTGQNPRKA